MPDGVSLMRLDRDAQSGHHDTKDRQLLTPPEVAEKIPRLDREVDRLLDLAVARRWTRAEFRQERAPLGRMAAEYLRHARRLAGLPDIDLPSIWAWDNGDRVK
ncbi:MAG TPA: hypothetical protein VEH31_29565 [Streptosporangiaceae bacterium]|nr:hypothetical protein [Streptosporangiaceae bacterium]